MDRSCFIYDQHTLQVFSQAISFLSLVFYSLKTWIFRNIKKARLPYGQAKVI